MNSGEFGTSRFSQGGKATQAPSYEPKHKATIKEQITGLKVPTDNELAHLTTGAGLPVPVSVGPPVSAGGAQEAVLQRLMRKIEQKRQEEGTTPPSGFKSPGYGQDPTNTPSDRPSMRTLNADSPVIPVPIYCKAMDCKFNKDKACTATSISVSSKGAECEMYRKSDKAVTASDLKDRKKIRTKDLIKTRKGPAIVVKRESSGYRIVYPNRVQKVVPFKKYEVLRHNVDFQHLLV